MKHPLLHTASYLGVVGLLLLVAMFGATLRAQPSPTPQKEWQVEHYDDAEMNVRCYVLRTRSQVSPITCMAYDPPEFP